MMDTDEIQIFEFLKKFPNRPMSVRELSRRVGGKKRLTEDPDWIRPVLRRMLMEEIIEADGYGQYQLKMRGQPPSQPAPKPKAQKGAKAKWETWELVLDEVNPLRVRSPRR
jgi:hypothetical protein